MPRRCAAVCPICVNWLERTAGRSVGFALATALATFILLIPANILPLLSISILGAHRQTLLFTSVVTIWNGQWVILAASIAAFACVLPLLRFGLLSLSLGLLYLGQRPSWLGRTFRWSMLLDQWAMPDVFLIGFAVGYSRVEANIPVTIRTGGLCLIGAALVSLLARATLDARTVWRALAPENPAPAEDEPALSCNACDLVLPLDREGSPCPRCGLLLRARRADVLTRTTALLMAAFALYLPANIYPMSTALQLGEEVPHRIIDGIRELFQAGLWPLGVLIFCTSIAIPLLKIVGLGWLTLSVRRRSGRALVLKTRLYRFIDEIGRWSNLDVFTIAVFVPLMQFGALATAHAAPGATAFVLVVVLTMLASRSFDPRMLWDCAARESA